MARGEQTSGELARREHNPGDRTQALAQDPQVSEVRELHVGEAEVGTGRISAARQPGDHGHATLFSVPQLARIDEALTLAERDTGVHFSVYLGQSSGRTPAGELSSCSPVSATRPRTPSSSRSPPVSGSSRSSPGHTPPGG